MTTLALADRLRVYAATADDNMVTLHMRADQARILADMLDERKGLDDLRASLIAQYRRDRGAMERVYTAAIAQACFLCATLAFWGIMA